MSKQQQKLNIGLFGFGVVGESLYKVLQGTPTLQATISKICIKHPGKQRSAPAAQFTTDAGALLNDPDINVIVELIDDAGAAYQIVSQALRNGKAVVSANKKLIAEKLPELIELQRKYGAPFLYEAACCASIPVIRNLEEYYDNDLLRGVKGIVNGSTNYILSRVFAEQLNFADALKAAQDAGFAESNPALDIEGTDAANKLAILLAHAYGVVAHPSRLLYTGIHLLQPQDAQYAREKGFTIKLVAEAVKLADGNIAALVTPRFVTRDDRLAGVAYEYNGVVIRSSLADEQFFAGKGAGGFPTASAVLSDLSALRYDYRYEYRKLGQGSAALANDYYLKLYIGAKAVADLPLERFSRILEWGSSDQYASVTGIIHVSALWGSDWWKQPGLSVILYPESIIEQDAYRAAHLSTAGTVKELRQLA